MGLFNRFFGQGTQSLVSEKSASRGVKRFGGKGKREEYKQLRMESLEDRQLLAVTTGEDISLTADITPPVTTYDPAYTSKVSTTSIATTNINTTGATPNSQMTGIAGKLTYTAATDYHTKNSGSMADPTHWAQTAAEMIWNSGWGKESGFDNVDSIFNHIVANFSEQPNGFASDVIEWFFNGNYEVVDQRYDNDSTWTLRYNENGGGFFQDVNYDAIGTYVPANTVIPDDNFGPAYNQKYREYSTDQDMMNQIYLALDCQIATSVETAWMITSNTRGYFNYLRGGSMGENSNVRGINYTDGSLTVKNSFQVLNVLMNPYSTAVNTTTHFLAISFVSGDEQLGIEAGVYYLVEWDAALNGYRLAIAPSAGEVDFTNVDSITARYNSDYVFRHWVISYGGINAVLNGVNFNNGSVRYYAGGNRDGVNFGQAEGRHIAIYNTDFRVLDDGTDNRGYATLALTGLNYLANYYEKLSPYSLADTTKLQSNKSATQNVIYLDASSFAPDFNAATLSFPERIMVQEIWQRVAEDYMPFNVNVTTDPTVIGARRVTVNFWAALSSTYQSVHTQINPMTSPNGNGPSIFTNPMVMNSSMVKILAEFSSYYSARSFGVEVSSWTHDDNGYPGREGWAPIMGFPDNIAKQFTQWSKGEYYGANNSQDQIAQLARILGLRSDDYGNTLADASPLTVVSPYYKYDTLANLYDGTSAYVVEETGKYNSSQNQYLISGIIEENTDYDVFSFDSYGGSYVIDVAGIGADNRFYDKNGNAWDWWMTNLNVMLEVLDSEGNLLQVISSTGTSFAHVKIDLSTTTKTDEDGNYLPTTHYIRISGTGEGNAMTTGFSDYGSLGSYTLSVTENLEDLVREDEAGNLVIVVTTLDDVVAMDGKISLREALYTIGRRLDSSVSGGIGEFDNVENKYVSQYIAFDYSLLWNEELGRQYTRSELEAGVATIALSEELGTLLLNYNLAGSGSNHAATIVNAQMFWNDDATRTDSQGNLIDEGWYYVRGANVTLDAGEQFRTVYVDNISTSLTGLIITGGNAQGDVDSKSSSASQDSPDQYGGGIFNHYGWLNVSDSIIAGNQALKGGGGIYNSAGYYPNKEPFSSGNEMFFNHYFGGMIVVNSTIAGNIATYDKDLNNGSVGGGIFNDLGSHLQMINCTVAGNMAAWSGGGVENYGIVVAVNSIFAKNEASRGADYFEERDATAGLLVPVTNFGGGLYYCFVGDRNMKNDSDNGTPGIPFGYGEIYSKYYSFIGIGGDSSTFAGALDPHFLVYSDGWVIRSTKYDVPGYQSFTVTDVSNTYGTGNWSSTLWRDWILRVLDVGDPNLSSIDEGFNKAMADAAVAAGSEKWLSSWSNKTPEEWYNDIVVSQMGQTAKSDESLFEFWNRFTSTDKDMYLRYAVALYGEEVTEYWEKYHASILEDAIRSGDTDNEFVTEDEERNLVVFCNKLRVILWGAEETARADADEFINDNCTYDGVSSSSVKLDWLQAKDVSWYAWIRGQLAESQKEGANVAAIRASVNSALMNLFGDDYMRLQARINQITAEAEELAEPDAEEELLACAEILRLADCDSDYVVNHVNEIQYNIGYYKGLHVGLSLPTTDAKRMNVKDWILGTEYTKQWWDARINTLEIGVWLGNWEYDTDATWFEEVTGYPKIDTGVTSLREFYEDKYAGWTWDAAFDEVYDDYISNSTTDFEDLDDYVFGVYGVRLPQGIAGNYSLIRTAPEGDIKAFLEGGSIGTSGSNVNFDSDLRTYFEEDTIAKTISNRVDYQKTLDVSAKIAAEGITEPTGEYNLTPTKLTDLAGDPRVVATRSDEAKIDMGAYEYQSTVTESNPDFAGFEPRKTNTDGVTEDWSYSSVISKTEGDRTGFGVVVTDTELATHEPGAVSETLEQLTETAHTITYDEDVYLNFSFFNQGGATLAGETFVVNFNVEVNQDLLDLQGKIEDNDKASQVNLLTFTISGPYMDDSSKLTVTGNAEMGYGNVTITVGGNPRTEMFQGESGFLTVDGQVVGKITFRMNGVVMVEDLYYDVDAQSELLAAASANPPRGYYVFTTDLNPAENAQHIIEVDETNNLSKTAIRVIETPSVIVTTTEDTLDMFDDKISLREAIEYASFVKSLEEVMPERANVVVDGVEGVYEVRGTNIYSVAAGDFFFGEDPVTGKLSNPLTNGTKLNNGDQVTILADTFAQYRVYKADGTFDHIINVFLEEGKVLTYTVRGKETFFSAAENEDYNLLGGTAVSFGEVEGAYNSENLIPADIATGTVIDRYYTNEQATVGADDETLVTTTKGFFYEKTDDNKISAFVNGRTYAITPQNDTTLFKVQQLGNPTGMTAGIKLEDLVFNNGYFYTVDANGDPAEFYYLDAKQGTTFELVETVQSGSTIITTMNVVYKEEIPESITAFTEQMSLIDARGVEYTWSVDQDGWFNGERQLMLTAGATYELRTIIHENGADSESSEQVELTYKGGATVYIEYMWGAEVRFRDDIFNDTTQGAKTITITAKLGDIIIDKNVTINASEYVAVDEDGEVTSDSVPANFPVTVNADGASRVFKIASETDSDLNVLLNNLVITGGYSEFDYHVTNPDLTAGKGGGIYAQAGTQLVLVNCDVTGNRISNKPGHELVNNPDDPEDPANEKWVNAVIAGAGVYIEGNLTLDHTTVSGNAMTGLVEGFNYRLIALGGGVYCDGVLVLENDERTEAAKRDGGLTATVIDGNTANISIDTASINSTVRVQGIGAYTTGDFAVSGINFTNNVLKVYDQSGTDEYLLSEKSPNAALDIKGGGLYVGGDAIVSHGVMTGNELNCGTGGFAYVAGEAFMTNLSLQSNKATYGGALGFGGESAYLAAVDFMENEAVYGGALYATSPVQVDNYVTAISNRAVAFSYEDEDKKTVTEGGDGGAFYLAEGGELSMTGIDVVLSGNMAANAGGAVYAKDLLTIQNNADGSKSGSTAIFESNRAAFGGALYLSGVAYINDVAIYNNVATNEGGAIYVAAASEDEDKLQTTVITNSAIVGNEAVRGGGLYAKGYAKLVNATVAGNVARGADATGAGVYAETSLVVENSIIANNNVPASADAIGSDLSFLATEDTPATDIIAVTNSLVRTGIDLTYPERLVLKDAIVGTDGAPIDAGFETVPTYDADGALTNLKALLEGGLVPKVAAIVVDGSNAALSRYADNDLAITVDLLGVNRVFGGGIDMGAYESQETVTYDLSFYEGMASEKETLISEVISVKAPSIQIDEAATIEVDLKFKNRGSGTVNRAFTIALTAWKKVGNTWSNAVAQETVYVVYDPSKEGVVKGEDESQVFTVTYDPSEGHSLSAGDYYFTVVLNPAAYRNYTETNGTEELEDENLRIDAYLNNDLLPFGGVPISGSTLSILPQNPFVVNTLEDLPTDLGDEFVSLREAMEYAMTLPGAVESITFDSSLDGGTIYLTQSLPVITRDLTIDASTLKDGLTVDGSRISEDYEGITVDPKVDPEGKRYKSLLVVWDYQDGDENNPGINVTIDSLNFANGDAGDEADVITNGGGAINSGAMGGLTLIDCDFTGNRASFGGAIRNTGVLTVTDCDFVNNEATRQGGALWTNSEKYDDEIVNMNVTLDRVTFGGNASVAYGGAIAYYGGDLAVYNTVFAGNSASHGGALFNNSTDGVAKLVNCTVVGNVATGAGAKAAASYGGGIYVYDGSKQDLANTIIAGNYNTRNLSPKRESDNIYAATKTVTMASCLASDDASDVNFVSFDEDTAWTQWDLCLTNASDAVDQGNNERLPEEYRVFDIEGNPRIVNDTVDIGAHEYNPKITLALNESKFIYTLTEPGEIGTFAIVNGTGTYTLDAMRTDAKTLELFRIKVNALELKSKLPQEAKTYTLWVNAVSGGKTYTDCFKVEVVAPPQGPAPDVTKVTQLDASSVQLTWTADPEQKEFRVRYQQVGTTESWTVYSSTLHGNTGKISDPSFIVGATYAFQVQAVGNTHYLTSEWSELDNHEFVRAAALPGKTGAVLPGKQYVEIEYVSPSFNVSINSLAKDSIAKLNLQATFGIQTRIVGWEICWGDSSEYQSINTTSNSVSVSHYYGAEGVYDIKFRMRDEAGNAEAYTYYAGSFVRGTGLFPVSTPVQETENQPAGASLPSAASVVATVPTSVASTAVEDGVTTITTLDTALTLALDESVPTQAVSAALPTAQAGSAARFQPLLESIERGARFESVLRRAAESTRNSYVIDSVFEDFEATEMTYGFEDSLVAGDRASTLYDDLLTEL
ncbi:MAG: hypothetical protein Q4G68_12945 [Planctomycetia bacterium]|nr:hypothetical protein [Planctomycetia bacterium]